MRLFQQKIQLSRLKMELTNRKRKIPAENAIVSGTLLFQPVHLQKIEVPE